MILFNMRHEKPTSWGLESEQGMKVCNGKVAVRVDLDGNAKLAAIQAELAEIECRKLKRRQLEQEVAAGEQQRRQLEGLQQSDLMRLRAMRKAGAGDDVIRAEMVDPQALSGSELS